jgi:phosphoribosylglycinamide formyltransferase 1
MVAQEVPSIAILASGSGSTAEACINATQDGRLRARVGLVVCNNTPEKAGVYDRVAQLNSMHGLAIPVLRISGVTHPGGEGRQGEQTLEESEAIACAVDEAGCSLIGLMGYMKKIRGPLLRDYGWQPGMDSVADVRMINTHPGPLPQTEGLMGRQASEAVIAMKLGYSAHTVHTVGAEYDQGMIIQETRVPVTLGDNADELFDRVQAVEKAVLPLVISYCLTEMGMYGDAPI